MEQHNPFESPVTQGIHRSATGDLKPAYSDRRFLNAFIDNIAVYALAFCIGVIGVLAGGESFENMLDQIPDLIFGMGLMLLYYVPLESLTGRTLGKLITGTMVVNEAGKRPTFVQAIGRTLCRFIPFDALTFLGRYPRGWHDKFSRTYVVKKSDPYYPDME